MLFRSAINLQTSFLTPPFGFSLFYLRGVADQSIQTAEIYRGVIPFILIQLFVLIIVMLFPDHGSRYLSKIYNEEWLNEQGFEKIISN